MINKVLTGVVFLVLSNLAIAGGMNDDPTLFKLMINQIETRNADGKDPTVWEAEMWVGKDLNKLWIKTEGEIVDGKTEEAEFQFLYSRGLARYWDFQVGWRRDSRPKPTRDWLAVGFKGLAPYFFEIDTALFIGSSGRTALRLSAEYEILFTQKLILTPEIETNIYGKSDAELGIGSGLSNISLGLRLRYEIRRQFAPYIGVYWTKKYGDTADFTRLIGDDVSDTQFVVGIRAWF